MRQKILISAFILLTTMVFSVNAQPTRKDSGCAGKGPMSQIPNLTEAQQTKITKIRTTHMKISNNLRNQLKEKRAHLQTLQSTDTPNQKDIDNTIDEITELQNKLMKNRTAMRLEIRNQLTDEQKVYFDSHMMKRKKAAKIKKMEH